jgi:hypothetical protein
MSNSVWRFCAAALVLSATSASAHGIVGERFFPATISVDDPFAADELALPTVSSFKPGGGPRETDTEFEWSKSILPGFALSFEGGYVDSPAGKGWDNLEITPVVQLIKAPESEFILSVGMGFEFGGTGSSKVADPFTTYTPEVLFGKGFGDLPDGAALLRPFAVTGRVAYAMPGTSTEGDALEWGGAIEYSLSYLTNNVRDVGLGSFVSHLTPLVEFSLESPRDDKTTGTINPGILWSGQYTQVGVEAIIPVNASSGHDVGVVAQLHFYMDDIFPHSLGKPLFGGSR